MFGGWQLAGLIALQTGQPFTVVSAVDVNLDGDLTDRLNTLVGVREANEGSLRYEFPATLEGERMLIAAGHIDGAVGAQHIPCAGRYSDGFGGQ